MAKGDEGANAALGSTKSVPAFAATPPHNDAEAIELADQSSRLIAFIDIISLDAIHGWAYDSHHPETSVAIEAVASNGKRLVTIANLEREDVRDAGHGTGKYGFVLDIGSLGLKDESVMVRFADSKHPITPEPVALNAERAVLTTKMPAAYENAMVLVAAQVQMAAELKGVTGGDIP